MKKRDLIKRTVACLLLLPIIFGMIGCSGNNGEKQDETTTDGNGTEASGNMTVYDLRTQSLTSPLGIQSTVPVFSWKLASDERGQKQTAYRITASSSAKKLSEGEYDIWDSGKVESDDSFGIEYGGKTLGSMQGVYWNVTVWDKDGKECRCTDAAYFETGLFEKSDWSAKWICAGEESVLSRLMPDKVSDTSSAGYILCDSVGETSGRYLRIKVSESGPAALGEYNDGGLRGVIYRVQIMELELYLNGKKAELPGGTTVTAPNTFTYGSQWGKDKLIDGSINDGYTSNTAAEPVYSSPVTVTLDFGEEIKYDEIRLVCRTDTASTDGDVCPNYPKKYCYEISSDGSA